MASISFGPSGFEAVRAYDPTRQYYSGLNGVLALLGHAILEITYRRVFEPRLVGVVKAKTGRARGGGKTRRQYAQKWQYRDTRQRSRVPVSPSWLGAPIRRMLVTRDFWMLNDWGGPLFGYVPPEGGYPTGGPDVLVVWDCLWHDWRRINLNQTITVTTVIPTSLYPGVSTGKPRTPEDIRMLEAERDVVNRIYEANFHGKGAALFRYMDNGHSLGLQQQEETARKQWFDKWDREKSEKEREEEEARRRAEEANRKKREEEDRRRQMEEEQARQRAEREAKDEERREAERARREEQKAKAEEERLAKEEERRQREIAAKEQREARDAERRAMEEERRNAMKEQEAARKRKEEEARAEKLAADEEKRAREEEKRLADEERKAGKAEDELAEDEKRSVRGTAFSKRIGPGAGRRFRG